VQLAVLAAADRPPEAVWLAADGGSRSSAEVAELHAVGRAFLAQSADAATSPPAHAHICPVRAIGPDGEAVGVVVAAKRAGETWSGAERALLEFAVGFYAPALADHARRPAGEPGSSAFATEDDLTSTMRSAADRDELFLLYQPEVDLVTGSIVAVEALARWSHPEHGELGPDSFIALAEQSDLIRVLGAWVVEESLRDFAAWQRSVPDLDVALRVNVSPAQLTDGSFVPALRAALVRHGVPGSRLCLELTENLSLIDVDQLRSCLAELREMDVSIALDDLASGYSSLGRLRAIPVEYVKIDRSLVAGIDSDGRARSIVHAVLQLAGELGAGAIVEGVETLAEAETLRGLGATRAQGHYFGRPTSAGSTVARLAEQGLRLAPRERGPADCENNAV
jgi:EAL domain-containing protein (putative c-di-GMP-specific phosphodiesterase class I)